MAHLAQSVECGEQRRGPGERSNERDRSIESRSARRRYMAEERTDEDRADDAQSEVPRDTLAGALEESDGDGAGDESEKDEDND